VHFAAGGYSPYEGRTVTGWPVTVVSCGRIVVDDGALRAAPGSGGFLSGDAGAAAGRNSTGERGLKNSKYSLTCYRNRPIIYVPRT